MAGGSVKNIYLWVLCIFLLGCSEAQNTQSDIVGTWYLQSLTNDNSSVEIESVESVFIHFNDNSTLNGNAGCNQFFAQYDLHEDTLMLRDSGITSMLCDRDSMQVETVLMRIISKESSTKIHIKDDKLIMQASQVMATFSR